ncbi:MAG: OmpA family protein [Arcobacteraceae bacterium]
MAKQKCPECPKCLPGWLVQFGDLMSLLLTFFILLLSMAVMDKKKVEEYFEIMKKAMGFLSDNDTVIDHTEKHSESPVVAETREIQDSSDNQEIVDEVIEIVKVANETLETFETIQLVQGKNEFVLDIPTTVMFEEGEYDLKKPEAKAFIRKIARVVRTMPNIYNIEIMGHTSRNLYTSSSIPRDNWDLSALRSVSVVKELIKNRIDPSQLKVSAFASFQPKSDNALENRRVEMRFYAHQGNQNILEEENFFDRIEE